ncbi:PREDICTED: serine/threonine-protein kinase BLUS1-like [Ipomoea nil]|uniref:serine/threonine-protein kinase BLUS1-like n=1 Tax=Ipomoea nil TaxID=35883 RepID=UPI0009013C83|nr:PREDICTED: serine/threonine-protein kinase BLUS1-like [Ipomoea nil]
MDKKKYPIGAEHYTLYEEIGQGVSASVHRALCIPTNEVVAVKILDFERDNCDLSNVFREAQTMVLVDHPNVLKSHCSFVSDHNLWVVMPFMAGGSCLHILKAVYPDGLEEVVIATILREILKGLEYLHQHGHIHRDVKAGNILIDARGGIKLGDFGVSACLFDSGDRTRMRNTFVGTPCWMAPEVMEQLHGYDFKADIWSFGITALELAHGHAPFSKYPPMKVLLMTLQNAPPGLDYERDKKFSKSFKQMIASCLVKEPSKRPSAKKLSKHSFFKQARSNDYIARRLLDGLPALGDRIRELKKKEEQMLAQKEIPDGQKEEISQNEYKRGISSWNFNLEDLKAQASLIPDEEILSVASSNSLVSLDTSGKKLQHQSSFLSRSSDNAETDDYNLSAPLSPVDPTSACNIAKCEKSDDDVSLASSFQDNHISRSSSPSYDNLLERNLPVKSEQEVDGKLTESSPTNSNQRNEFCSPCNDAPAEAINRTSRTSANGEDSDDKTKCPIVQQKGRFKVTSENVDLEKVPPTPMLPKSHSVQAFTQHPSVSQSFAPESMAPNIPVHSFFRTLQNILQTNIIQRDNILSLMRQATGSDPIVDSGSLSLNHGATEKSLLEIAHDKEKELLREISDLQWRLICAQEELQRYKTDNAQI